MLPAGLFLAAAAFWVAALILAPLAFAFLQPGQTLYTGAAMLYAAASAICHQRPERSLHLLGSQLPVCARCFGAYVGVAAGAALPALAAWTHQVRPEEMRTWRRALIATGAVVAATYVIEWAGLPPGNAVRAVTAVPFGAVAGALVAAVARDFRPGARSRPGSSNGREP